MKINNLIYIVLLGIIVSLTVARTMTACFPEMKTTSPHSDWFSREIPMPG